MIGSLNADRMRAAPSERVTITDQRVLAGDLIEGRLAANSLLIKLYPTFITCLVHKIIQVAQRALRNFRQCLLSEEGLVTTHQHIVECSQSHQDIVLNNVTTVVLVKECTLALVNIQAQAAQVSALEGVDDTLSVDETSAGGVDNHGPFFRLGERLLVDDVTSGVH